jgi:hypothetical protein
MLYDRMWFHKDLFALMLGGGAMSNWGRYLTLLPASNGAWVASGSAYARKIPETVLTCGTAPSPSNACPNSTSPGSSKPATGIPEVPYFSGRGGVTPPRGNNGLPQFFTCLPAASARTAVLAAAEVACGGPGTVWFPDLRRSEAQQRRHGEVLAGGEKYPR